MDSTNVLILFAKMLWPLGVAVIFVFLVKVIFEILLPNLFEKYKNKKRFEDGKKWRNDRELLKWLQDMTPVDFEKYIAELFKKLGYSAETVGKSHDGGIDVNLEKDGRKSYVQCKKYSTSTVSVGEIRDFYGALADKLSDGQGFFVTTNIFTAESYDFTKDKPIELIDGKKLVEYIHLTEKDEKDFKLDIKCPKCGGDLISKYGKYGKFIGCSNYPKCEYAESVK